jgi:hypothetical protein
MASVEHEGDSRAVQAEAVLKIVKSKLKGAHTRIDRQDARYRNLFLAYFEFKARGGETCGVSVKRQPVLRIKTTPSVAHGFSAFSTGIPRI